MTLALFEKTDLAAITVMLAAIPETVGMLALGVGLVVVAVSVRSFLKRRETTDVELEK